MTYTNAISSALLETLDRTVTLKAPDFAGHAANAEFWAVEAAHCIQVLEGYRERFDRMAAARERYYAEHGMQSPKLESAHDKTDQRSARVRETVSRFLRRCFHDGHVTGPELDDLCEKATIEYISWS